ncbi:hypothetical protein [Usitatibacter palustris]|uniref:Uncharacterized protein n=1 Tax=Usitatibacter palustris TaxID=2732487 RepID=A0A6M4HAQ9_9PROT|nr:hypothetical protein [Usitatibacter palustris]QJR15127.1 hypothetical protein DSM104440_01944 [Usitatibacter palustris]
MKKGIVFAACVLGLAVSASASANFKKTYCGNVEYVGNPGNTYPHLHCDKDFVTYSDTKTKHRNLVDGQGSKSPGCKRARELVAERPYAQIPNAAAIDTAVNLYVTGQCQ